MIPKILLRQGVESALLSGVEGPGLATIEYRAKHAGLIHLYLGADDQYGVISDPLPAAAPLQIRLFSSVSRERLLEMFEPR